MNELLNKDLKVYIKKVACYPNRITESDFNNNMGFKFKPNEKCHVNLLTIEAKKQVELIHALQVINKYLSKKNQ